jgi:dihydrofolate reductase
MPFFSIEGHAIVSEDDCICDAAGIMPPGLKCASDWTYFQNHLDDAAIVITGRHGHEAHPNKPGRKRLVFTSKAEQGFARHGDIAFLDPSRFDLQKAFNVIAPQGGMVAVTGGGPVFDWFSLHGGYDAFHLVRAHGVLIPDGRPVFTAGSALETLAALNLSLVEKRWLSEEERTELLLHRKA